MQPFVLTLIPRAAFGTRPLGDTLFGQLCWAVRNRFGAGRLQALLERYRQMPFAVVSDAFPKGYIPRPMLPAHWFAPLGSEGVDRKAAKKRVWMPVDHVSEPVERWLTHCKSAGEVAGGDPMIRPQPHNALNRLTGTTGEGQFAPYTMSQLWFSEPKSERRECEAVPSDVALDVYVILDVERISVDELNELFDDIGAIGFGRDASIGLGKFERTTTSRCEMPEQDGADTWLTLAPCAPQGLGFDRERSFYQPFTRFGRHGDIGVHSKNPFKTPVLLARSGAVMTPATFQAVPFIGQGLGGDGSLSKSIAGTVQQAYAPVVGIRLPHREAS